MNKSALLFSDGQKIFTSGNWKIEFEHPTKLAPTLIETIDISDLSEEDFLHGLTHIEDFEIVEHTKGKRVQRIQK